MTTPPSTYLANPSGACCLEGVIHSGTPRGSFTTISSVETYIVSPKPEKSNDNIILYFADVWGLFTNGLLIMDGFAEAGYLVLGLDYFRGDPVTKHRKDRTDTTTDPGFDYEAWKAKHTAFADEAVPKWVEAVKTQFGKEGTRFACVGAIIPFLCGNRSYIPYGISSKAIDILREGEKPYQVQLFQGVQHGFALRGNMEKPYERYVKEQSLKGIIEWLDFWLSQ